MKNHEAHYVVEGSTALKPDCLDNIIEFPYQPIEDQLEEYEEVSRRSYLGRIFESEFFQTLKHGSIQGKSFNLAKPWQSWLTGTAFLVVALACIYFSS